jgi:hypothetical protein
VASRWFLIDIWCCRPGRGYDKLCDMAVLLTRTSNFIPTVEPFSQSLPDVPIHMLSCALERPSRYLSRLLSCARAFASIPDVAMTSNDRRYPVPSRCNWKYLGVIIVCVCFPPWCVAFQLLFDELNDLPFRTFAIPTTARPLPISERCCHITILRIECPTPLHD